MKLAASLASVAVMPIVACIGIAAATTGSNDMDLASTSCNVNGNPTMDEMDIVGEQVDNAVTIYTVGAERDLPSRAMVIATATALQESTLHNYDTAVDHDSLGLFQQRPSQGWGTPEQLTDPEYAAGAFYDSLLEVTGWETLPITDAAQAVQKSAYPDAYASHESQAERIVDAIANITDCTMPADGWTNPAPGATAGSGFHTSDRPDHDGVDFIAERGSDIHAAGPGTVITVLCNASTMDGAPHSCDRDGGMDIAGCGWYVEIAHPDDTITRYCHMGQHPNVDQGDTVTAGDVIGHVGSSGNSSGPHLHFEAHTAQPPTSDNATEPLAYL
ncbi:MAG: M23 family metallopeptidase, partial [Stackebrandtia sp.]